jgi:hypothetical protein
MLLQVKQGNFKIIQVRLSRPVYVTLIQVRQVSSG